MAISSCLTLLLLLLLVVVSVRVGCVQIVPVNDRCEPLTIDLCKSVGYDTTFKGKNLAGHTDQGDAGMILMTFEPLVHYNCSRNLRFFLCSVFAPMCDKKWEKPIGPCRPLCESIFVRCNPVLRKFSLSWPPYLNCSRFPVESGNPEMCLELEPIRMEENPIREFEENAESDGRWHEKARRWRQLVDAKEFGTDCKHLRNNHQYVYVNYTVECALSCLGNDLFTQQDKKLAEVWMGVLATLCALSSLLTILTFLMDRSRFKYPVRPVIFMSLCYLCYSLSYFLRLGAGRESAACDKEPVTGKSILIRHGLNNTNCAIVFLLQYFFSTAASVWYVILVLTWLLQAGWKWSPEAVDRRSCYFHLPAWIVPVGLTVCVLIVRRVEADELLGMCNVGNQNRDTLLTFVIVPNVLFLGLEFIFLLAGFIAMVRVRRHAKSDGQITNKFDILMVKIGLFSALYIIPTACITGFNVYEYANRDLWHMPDSPYSPSVSVFLIRVFASLAIGLTTILWIWGGKTLSTWRNFFTPSSRRGRIPYPKTAYQVGMQHQPASPTWHKQQQQQQQQHSSSELSTSEKLRSLQHQHQQQHQLSQQQQQHRTMPQAQRGTVATAASTFL